MPSRCLDRPSHTTGSDLARYASPGTVFAGFHYGALCQPSACVHRPLTHHRVWADLNFLTIHGKSRFPGLFIWLRDGRRVSVVVPDGCLLIQVRPQGDYGPPPVASC